MNKELIDTLLAQRILKCLDENIWESNCSNKELLKEIINIIENTCKTCFDADSDCYDD